MIVRLDTHRLQTLDQVREFLDGSEQVDLQPQTRADSYAFVAKTVRRFDYALRGKADKGLLRRLRTPGRARPSPALSAGTTISRHSGARYWRTGDSGPYATRLSMRCPRDWSIRIGSWNAAAQPLILAAAFSFVSINSRSGLSSQLRSS